MHPLGPFAPAIVTYTMLQPLFPFSNLRQLVLSRLTFDLTDTEVKGMAMAWPHLEQLHFDVEFHISSEPQTTLRSLLWMAISCRALVFLSFTFTGTCSFSDEELSMAADHQLKFLDVGNSAIDNLEQVSAFLKTVFPVLLQITWKTFCPHGERWGEMWRGHIQPRSLDNEGLQTGD
ncbi:hypothetical protein BDZ97DRAFT_1211734 [Flammula alnicola]|nr:hypothetical protein BDZ97DRAFT_1211734 [Flammula alnicola]